MKGFVINCEERDFSLLAQAFEGEVDCDCTLCVEIIFVGEDEIKELNARTRSVDAVTDVLSYPMLNCTPGQKISGEDYPFDRDEEGNLFIGSVAICLKRAEEQAAEYGHSVEREVNYLATHGICHLLGYDHMDEKDKPAMRAAEERVLARLNLTR